MLGHVRSYYNCDVMSNQVMLDHVLLGRVRSWEVILGHVWSNYVTVLIKSYYVVLSQCHDYVCFYAEHNFV